MAREYNTNLCLFLQIHFLCSILRRPQHTDRISEGVLKMFRRNRNHDSCKKNATGTENIGIRRIPAGTGNLGAALSLSCHANWLSHHLSSPSHCAALSLSCFASWLLHCLSPPSSCCATLSSTSLASLMSHCLSSSSRCAPCHPLVISSRRLVVALPLDAPPSCRLVVLSCRLSLSRCASWLLRYYLSSSSCCTACNCKINQ
jgi:hypothetical protein